MLDEEKYEICLTEEEIKQMISVLLDSIYNPIKEDVLIKLKNKLLEKICE